MNPHAFAEVQIEGKGKRKIKGRLPETAKCLSAHLKITRQGERGERQETRNVLIFFKPESRKNDCG